MPHRKAYRIFRTKRINLLVVIAAIVFFFGLGASLVYGFIARNNQQKNCAAALEVRDAVLFILVDAKRATHQFGTATTRSDLFYDRSTKKLRAVTCVPPPDVPATPRPH
jgi:hypothetical protein